MGEHEFQAFLPGMPSSLTYDPQVCHKREERGRAERGSERRRKEEGRVGERKDGRRESGGGREKGKFRKRKDRQTVGLLVKIALPTL